MKRLVILSAVGVLSLATVGGFMFKSIDEEPQKAQSAVTSDGEAKESPKVETVEVEKIEEVKTIQPAETIETVEIVEPAETEEPEVKNKQDKKIVWISGTIHDGTENACFSYRSELREYTDKGWQELISTNPGHLGMIIRQGTGQFFCSTFQESL